MTTRTVSGSFALPGTGGTAGAVVSAWAASRFGSGPAFDTSPPAGSADFGPVRSGTLFGAPGAYQLAVNDGIDYWLQVQYGGHTYWVFEPDIVAGITDPTKATLVGVVGPFTSGGSVTVNKLNPVNAVSAPITMTLPTGQTQGTWVAVQKTDSSTNAVTVSGSIRGSAGSITLALLNETIWFTADSAGSWWPLSSHKTLSSLDARYLANATLVGSSTSPINLTSAYALALTGPVTWLYSQLTANCALTISGLVAKCSVLVFVQQDATGGHTLTINGVAITIPLPANANGFVQMWSDDGTNLEVMPGPQQGPQGNTGPTGATGSTGGTGPTGPPGIAFSTYTAITAPQNPMVAGTQYTINTGGTGGSLTLPSGPTAGQIFGVQRGTYTGNIVINAGAGQTINGGATAGNIQSGATNNVAGAGAVILVATSSSTFAVLAYTNQDFASGWVVTGNNFFSGTTTQSGRLQVNGTLALGVVAKTANFTTLNTQSLIVCTANAFTITLGTTSFVAGGIQVISNQNTLASGHYITLAAATGTIDNTVLPPGASVVMEYDGTNWHTISEYGLAPNNAAATTVSGTAGSLTCSQPFVGVGYKKALVIVGSTFSSVGGVTYTFPVPFTSTPVVTASPAGTTVTATTTGVTVVASPALGFLAGICVEGA